MKKGDEITRFDGMQQPKIHRKIHTSLWILNISRKKSANQKVSTLLPNLCDFHTKIHTPAYGFKNLWPSVWIFILCDCLYIPLSSFFHVSLSPISSPLTAKKNFKLLMDFSVELGKSLLVCYGSKTFSFANPVFHASRTVFATLRKVFRDCLIIF